MGSLRHDVTKGFLKMSAGLLQGLCHAVETPLSKVGGSTLGEDCIILFQAMEKDFVSSTILPYL